MILSNLPAYMPGLARAYFFVTETSTPSTVYQDADGLDAHTNPVLASAAGILPAIFLDPAVTYRVVYTGEDGDLTNPLWEADPVTAPSIGVSTFNTRFGNVTLNTGDIEDALGYTPGTDEPASDTSAGLIEIATDAETQAGVDATKAVTPAGLASMVPTDTTRGLVEIATSTEIKAGTDDERAITPAGLKAIAFRSGEISLTVGERGPSPTACLSNRRSSAQSWSARRASLATRRAMRSWLAIATARTTASPSGRPAAACPTASAKRSR